MNIPGDCLLWKGMRGLWQLELQKKDCDQRHASLEKAN